MASVFFMSNESGFDSINRSIESRHSAPDAAIVAGILGWLVSVYPVPGCSFRVDLYIFLLLLTIGKTMKTTNTQTQKVQTDGFVLRDHIQKQGAIQRRRPQTEPSRRTVF